MKARLLALLTALVLVVAGGPTSADFEERPVVIVVSTPPGGGVDRIGRLFAQRLERQIERRVIVDNRPGAAGRLATEHVARAAPDGATLLLTTGSSTIDLAFHADLRPNAVDDLAPISLLAIDQATLVVLPSSPSDSVAALVARARAAPGDLSFAAVGPLSTMRVVGELFQLRTGTRLLPVPYKGEADVLRALMARDVDSAIVSMSSAQPLVAAGKLRALAIAGDRRSPQLPDVPTFAEAGVAGVEADIWYGLFAPAGTSAPMLEALAAAAAEITAQPDYRQAIVSAGQRPVSSAPTAFATMLQTELARHRKVIAEAHLRLD